MSHRLDPLLRPGSVAVVGASAKPASMGDWALRNLIKGGFRGEIYPVNPNYDELQGHRCYKSLSELPAVPELAIFAVGDQRIEAALDEAIALGVPAAVVHSTAVLDDDEPPLLKARLQEKIQAAGMLVCGTNGMGFYNIRDHVWGCGFDSAMHEGPGSVSLISHSGAGMSGLLDCEQRLRFNFAVSTGNEISVSMDQYLDFVLDLPETCAVGLFIETARNPEGLRAAFEKARQRRIPIVAIKVGKTERSARLTVSHTGAMAGDDAAFEALFDRYGVTRVADMDQLATTLISFAELHPVAAGGLVTLHDSGGERQLIIDLADDLGVPLTELQPATMAELAKVLDPELPAVNPLDSWSRGGPDYEERTTRALTILLQDEGAALGAAILNRAPEGKVYPMYMNYVQRAKAESGKPVALVSAHQGSGYDELAVTATHAGIPVLDGVAQFLKGVAALFTYRDFLLRDTSQPVAINTDAVRKWQSRLQEQATLDEQAALKMLRDFGLPASRTLAIASVEALAEVSEFPVALKTAAGIAHKSDVNGVILNIATTGELWAAYEQISAKLGPEVIVAPMAAAGVEMILGATKDPQFGPVVVIGFGGVLAETLHDVTFALPPFDAAHARYCLDRLRLRPLLDGVRGKPAADIDAFCALASQFSVMVAALRDELLEVDINPVIVHAAGGGCTIVDALVVGGLAPAVGGRHAGDPSPAVGGRHAGDSKT
ncbi:MAG: acetate--CoA ligase family protein [Proteobacteria bacterium]|nr:acetate--CoA ligase family protein [Pseudomonadota bacterium]MDA1062757.1 acetate--CoA ligase family protein [Pseudomonadota bacterium]